MRILNEHDLTASIAPTHLNFKTTQELCTTGDIHALSSSWVAQSDAEKAAKFGLGIQQAGFNVLVLGQHGAGRTSLMQSAMFDAAKQANRSLSDLVAISDFESANQPILLQLPVGVGAKLAAEADTMVTTLALKLPDLFDQAKPEQLESRLQSLLNDAMANIEGLAKENQMLNSYLSGVSRFVKAAVKAWQSTKQDTETIADSLLSDSFLARLRVNLLVDNSVMQQQSLNQAVIYDQDPSYQTLFGTLEGTAEHTPDFMRLRAGNLHKANGGMLMLQLRDLLADEQNGMQLLEKLYRFLRNRTLQFEDHAHGAASSCVIANTLMTVNVKLVLIALREDFYSLLEENPDFFDYFPIKVEFVDTVTANENSYAALAHFVAHKCEEHQCAHFDVESVAELIVAQQRLEEDQARMSTNFAYLEQLMLESVAHAGNTSLVSKAHVKAAVAARNLRHRYFETQIRESIEDNELLIQVSGHVVGQVNGLTHVELGDASFGSPIRITARCYPGQKGLINIDREVNMSGPNHDKGIFILQNWLNASFSNLAPLSLNASLVFEQEYNGVDGDSASCAELFALLSALANLPIKQGMAVTGAMNQFGEVMPVGGVNEKIEGYFRVCKALGLDGEQGVIIPQRNQRHLMLDDEVIAAVKAGQFRIITIDHVLEGVAYLTDQAAGEQMDGQYESGSVMGNAQRVLTSYRQTLAGNQSKGNSHDD